MTSSPRGPAAEDTLLVALHALRAEPPAGFAERILTRLGLPATPDDVDEFVLADGPTGPLFVAFNPCGISHVLAAGVVEGAPQAFAAVHARRFGRAVRPVANPPAGLLTALRTGQAHGLRYDLRALSDFEQAVLRKALDIPRGELRPYAWIAREIGRPKAVRAVGSALGRNPVPVLIPCHRVVRSDGTVGNYAFGTRMKRQLLEAEQVDLAETELLGRRGTRFIGSDSTKVFCFPTCHNARRITSGHRVEFTGIRQAYEAGHRPCLDCRPAEPGITDPMASAI
jgi:O-6-methylguanine DNA methyltransferase